MTDTRTDAGTATADEKRRKLAALLARRSEGPKDRPLSIGQERLHRLASLHPDQPFYNVACAHRLSGPLDVTAVDWAVRAIERRHEVLRTTFPLVDGAPVQRIAPVGTMGAVFRAADLAGAPEAAVEAEIRGEIAQSMDLEAGPLWRVALLAVGKNSHVLTLTMHHIVSDGWSFELLLRELGALIGARMRREEVELPPPPQYAEYARRQRADLDAPDVALQRRYWTDQMAGTIPALALPAGGGDPAAPERAAASSSFALSRELSAALQEIGRREGASLFMTTLTAFAAVLNQACGQEDLLVCTPVTGRHRAQSREVVGYCNNILPIRLDLTGDPTFGEALARVRRVTLDAYKNQDVPFEQIAEAPSLRRIALSRLLFSLDMAWPPALAVDGVETVPHVTETGVADFDLSVSLWLAEDRICGALRYKTALFDAARAEEILTAFRAALEDIAATPDMRLSARPAAGLTARARDDARVRSGADRPQFALEQTLAQEWAAAFGRSDIGIHDDFRTLGASSLAIAELGQRLREAFDVDIPLIAIFRAGTIRSVAQLLQSEDRSLDDNPAAPIQPLGPRPPLFLCEGFGVYHALASRLGENQPVYGLVRNVVEDHPSVADIAAHYRHHIRRIQPEGPYRLGGLSFGGLVALEVAQQLREEGAEVSLLALFDTPGPDAYRSHGGARWVMGHLRNLLRFRSAYLRRKLARRLRVLNPRDATSGALPEEDEVRRLFRQSAEGYAYRPYAGRIVLFRLAARDAMSDSLFDPALGEIDPALGWGAVAIGGVEVHEIGGDHVGMLTEPHVSEVAAGLRPHLDALGAFPIGAERVSL
jgi:thioesterase domain-containing protein/acyl carrier protein